MHTPGPWNATEENVGGGLNVYAGPLRVAHTAIISAVNASRYQSRALEADEAKANSRLIAAAPELLAALQCALFDLEQTYSHVSSVSADRIKTETIPLARTAIAKATGKS